MESVNSNEDEEKIFKFLEVGNSTFQVYKVAHELQFDNYLILFFIYIFGYFNLHFPTPKLSLQWLNSQFHTNLISIT